MDDSDGRWLDILDAQIERDRSHAARRAQWMEPCVKRTTGWDRLPHNRRRWDVALMVGWLSVVVCAAIWAVLS